MDLGLQGKIAWVLGASSGIGLAAAQSLAREGAHVAISARDEERLKVALDEVSAQASGAGDGPRCIAVPLDVSQRDAVVEAARRVTTELGTVNVLVVNAGGPPPGAFADLDDARLDDAYELTLVSAWKLCKQVVDDMKASGGGCIVFLTSWSTKEVIPGLLLSNTLRVAVVGFAKTLSKELGPFGIRVVCVAPGRIETPRLRSIDEATAARSDSSVAEVAGRAQREIPLGRYGRPEEVGDAIAWLASERASYITGITLLIDGGMLSGILS